MSNVDQCYIYNINSHARVFDTIMCKSKQHRFAATYWNQRRLATKPDLVEEPLILAVVATLYDASGHTVSMPGRPSSSIVNDVLWTRRRLLMGMACP